MTPSQYRVLLQEHLLDMEDDGEQSDFGSGWNRAIKEMQRLINTLSAYADDDELLLYPDENNEGPVSD